MLVDACARSLAVALFCAAATIVGPVKALAQELSPEFAKHVTGVWSPLPLGTADDLTASIVTTALARCGVPGPLFVEFQSIEKRLLRLGAPGEDAVILGARSGAVRGQFTSWLVASSAGVEVLLLGTLRLDEIGVPAMITEGRNYVRCSVKTEENDSTDGK